MSLTSFRVAIVVFSIIAFTATCFELARTSAAAGVFAFAANTDRFSKRSNATRPMDAGVGMISLTTLSTAYTQNFDTLSNTAGSTTNTITITGWYMTETGGGIRDNEQYAVDTGGSTTGDTYSYGAAASTDRALGALRSGTLIPLYGAEFTNNTGSTINSLNVSYTGEEWRLGTAARTDQINFEISTNATDLSTGTYTGVPSLNFVTPDTVTAGAKNGNAAADRTSLTATISGLNIPNGASFWIRWTDTDATGADDGLAVDDFSLTPQMTTAAPVSIAGRVMTTDGQGIGRVSVMVSGGDLTQPRYTSTTSTGDYTVSGLTAGQTYIVTVKVKNYSFAQQQRVVNLLDDLTEFNFVANSPL